MARRMVAMDSASSCGPHPKDHPPPPTAQDPNPSVVILSPLEPSRRVGNAMCFSFFYGNDFIERVNTSKYTKLRVPAVVLHCHRSFHRPNSNNVYARFERLRFSPLGRVQTPRDVFRLNSSRY